MLKSVGVEQAGMDFTDKVMSQVEGIEISPVRENSPLISKTGWVIIGAVFSGLLIYALNGNTTNSNLFEIITLPEWFSINQLVSSEKISETIIFSAGLFAVLFILQIGYMKSYFNKRFEY